MIEINNEKIDDYLKQIQATETENSRVYALIDKFKDSNIGNIKQIFIEEGDRSLQLITDKLIIEFENYLQEDEKMIMFSYINTVCSIEMKPSNYNYSTFSEDSELLIKVIYENGVISKLIGKGINCKFLFEYVNNVLLPNTNVKY